MNEENLSAPEEQKEKKMKRFVWILAAIALVVVVGVVWAQLPATKDSGPENSQSAEPVAVKEWKHDMTDIGLPVLHFVPSSFRDDDTSTAFVSGTYAADEGECQVFFWDKLDTGESLRSQDTNGNDFYFQFFNALFQCLDPEPESWDLRFADIDAFMLSYNMSCDEPSLRRFGWPGDSGDTGLECVPDVFEFLN